MDTKALRQKVLDLAIRGKLVPQDPNDEPASALLERIRQLKQQMVKEDKLKAKDIKNDTVIFVGEDNLHYEKFADGTVKCIEDEIPFDLPDGWAWARLGAVAEAIGDGDHQPPPQTSFGIPFLVISNVSGGQLSFENTRFVSEEYFSQLPETRKPRNGDLLFTVTGSYGIPVLVDTDDKFCFQRHIAIVRPCIISNRYLYVVLGSSYVKSICDAKATGTAQKTVGLATLRELLIPVAPYKEQMQIYAQTQDVLNIVDSISSDKEDLLNIIENSKAKILDLAIRGKLVPQDPTDEPASVLLEIIRAEKEELIRQGKIKRDKKESVIFRGEDNSYYEKIAGKVVNIDDEMPFELPVGWMWCRFSEVIELFSGKDLTPDRYSEIPQGIPYITGASNLENGSVIVNRWTTSATTHTTVGDLLLTVKGSGVGKMAICDIEDAHIARQIMALRCRNGITQEYVQIVVSAFLTEITNQANGIIPGIRREVVLGTLFPLPPTSEQLKISTKVNCAIGKLQMIEKSLN